MRPRFVLLLVALVYLLFFYRLTDRDLWGSHEARAAQDAGSILYRNDWGLPRLTDERPDLQKPPMYYWLVALIAKARGEVDAWSVRLPAALAATLCVALVAGALWRRGRPIAAMTAAVLLITAQHYTWLARTARIDMPLALCTTIAVLTIGLNRRWAIVGFAAMAAGTLLKGPVGLVLPLAVILADEFAEWRLGERGCVSAPRTGSVNDDHARSLAQRVLGALTQPRSPGIATLSPLWWGLPLTLALAAPWFLHANARTNGEFFRVFFWHHNFERAMGGTEDLAEHPWWYYGPRLLADALPASLILIPAIVFFLRNRRWREDREARFGLIWLSAVVVVLSFAKFKRADYLLPAYPGLAIFLGCVAERFYLAAKPRIRRALVAMLATTVAATVAAWGYFLHVEHPRLEPRREHATFARAVREAAPAPNVVLLFRVECHALAFHLGRPINTLLEWENLDVWAGRARPTYVLMSNEDAAEWPKFLTRGRLDEVMRNPPGHDKPLVLLRTRPATETENAASRKQASDSQRPDQPGAAGARHGPADRPGGAGVDQRVGEARPPLRTAAGG